MASDFRKLPYVEDSFAVKLVNTDYKFTSKFHIVVVVSERLGPQKNDPGQILT